MAKETIANGLERPATVESPSQRPTFFKHNPHLGGKIAIEEHFNTDIFNASFTTPFTEGSGELGYYEKACVDDVGLRLASISLTMPGIEGIFDTAMAVEIASKVNDQMYKLYRMGPHRDRFLT
jgi:hypothetical protein